MSKTTSTLLPSLRISFALVLISVSLILIADLLNFTPSERNAELKARQVVSEALATQFSALGMTADNRINKILSILVKRNNEILSAGIRDNNGQLIYGVGNHVEQWGDYNDQKSTLTHLVVPMFEAGKPWGVIELKFAPLAVDRFQGVFSSSIYKLIVFIVIFGFFVFLLFILRIRRLLDPAAVIPERVSAAFDTLEEGVLILDRSEHIVLANKTMSKKLNKPVQALLGMKASEFDWKVSTDAQDATSFPWIYTQLNGESYLGKVLKFIKPSGDVIKFTVNTAPIYDAKGELQGVLTTFDDVTELEEKNQKLIDLVHKLETAQAEIKERNKELHYLATRDPLTGSLNRRAFYQAFEQEFTKAKNEGLELCCIMVDLDKFKLVNDNYGHATGDEVIKLLANVLHTNTRKVDWVGRYGGEEFCVVFPGLTIDEVISVAERIRLRVHEDSVKIYAEKGPIVTGSIGVASIFDHAKDAAELNDQADKALYVAKESGRNRVVRWESSFESAAEAKEKKAKTPESDQVATDLLIPSQNEISELQSKVKELETIATKFSNELEQSQHFDSFTGLPSHTLFCDRIEQAINRAARRNCIVAVLMMNVSVFNRGNKSLGQSGHGMLLMTLVERLESVLRNTDGITLFTNSSESKSLSMLGEEEFCIMLSDLATQSNAIWIIQRIFDSLSLPIPVNEQKLFITSYLGISLYPFDSNNPETLIEFSYTANRFAQKMPGLNNFHYHNAHFQDLSEREIDLDIELKRAIDNREWLLFYQPRINASTGKIDGVEALLRWNHPHRGVLLPSEFLVFAEQRNFMVIIGEWVLQEACSQLKIWSAMGIKDLKIAVNLTLKQLLYEDMLSSFLKILEQADVSVKYLELEITEDLLLDNLDLILPILTNLHTHAIHVTVEDFGSGQSSLSGFKDLPINAIKLDRSLIEKLISDPYGKNVVHTFISFAHGLGATVMAEGVENRAQLDVLKMMGCDAIQGYQISKPLPLTEITKLLRSSNL